MYFRVRVTCVSRACCVLRVVNTDVADGAQEEREQIVANANPADVAHDHDYCTRSTQAGGAFGFDSSSDEEPRNEADDNVSDTTEETENAEGDEAVNVDAGEQLHLDDLYEVIDHRVKRLKKFGLNGYATKFVLKDDERVDQPVEMLRHVLQRFIDDALDNSREHGFSTDLMGLSFITDRMKMGNGGKGEWLVPVSPPNENNADKILQETEKFDQSGNSPELFGNQITMVVTTIRRPVGGAIDRLIRKKQIRRPKTKKDPAIVEINNCDNLCLFRAIEVHRFYHETGEGAWQSAQRYASKGDFDLAASTLRARAGIRRKSAYGVDDAKAVFEYLQKKCPNEYRILIFTKSSKQQTVYNTGNNAKDAHKPYSCDTFHRCPFCCVHYKCEAGKKNGGHDCGETYCRKCGVKHRGNAGCFITPLPVKQSKPHRIVAYDVEAIIQKSQKPPTPRDEEEQRSRKNCSVKQKTTLGQKEKEEEEDEEKFGVSDDPDRTDHEVNYIAAIVMCSECIDHWMWADYEKQNCEICGPRKVFKCGEWEVVEEGRDVVGEFLDFLLHVLPAGYPTYANAHNGGRYDGAFLLQKLQARPKLRPTVTNSGHKYFQISVKQSKHNNAVHLRDSCLLFPMRLHEAPDAFNLPAEPKGDFPYLYNIREN
ncbi:hypothetical protein AAVH_24292 [Aphelenchoides avenae]|nr:hypothetical protein AAVH_24292 [Aphelenchus avenae]